MYVNAQLLGVFGTSTLRGFLTSTIGIIPNAMHILDFTEHHY